MSKAVKTDNLVIKNKWRTLKKRWKILFTLIIIIILYSVFSTIVANRALEASKQIIVVGRQDLIKESIRSGEVESQGVVKVTPQITGVVTQLNVENGDEVKAGQALFKVQSTISKAEKAQARANLLVAKNAYQDAQITIGDTEWASFESAKQSIINIERQIEIFENERPSEKDSKDYHALKSSEAAAKNSLNMAEKFTATTADRIAAAKANYESASLNYQLSQDLIYTAPVAGRIENMGINIGENVTAGIGDKEGTALFLIVPDTKKTISMQIGASDATVLKVGQSAKVINDTFPDKSFTAKIVRIDRVGKLTDKGLSYRAWLELDDEENILLLGMPVEIGITVADKKQVLAIPQKAISGGTVNITNEKKEIVEKRAVKTGLKSSGLVEITEGLAEGDQILIIDGNSKNINISSAEIESGESSATMTVVRN